jgi:hypothetical protein
MSLDDFVVSVKRINGQSYAERLSDGVTVFIDSRMYQQIPILYKEKFLYAHVDTVRNGIPAKELAQAICQREQLLRGEQHVKKEY